MPENIRRARRSVGLGLTILVFVVLLCVLGSAQFLAAIAAGLMGPAPLMVLALQTIGGTVLLLTSESEARGNAGTSVARLAILRISIAVAMATMLVIGLKVPFGYGIALAMAVCTLYWFWGSVPGKHGFGLRRIAVTLLAGLGVLLLSGAWHHVVRGEDLASAFLCALCVSILCVVAQRKARAGTFSAYPVFGWMALTVLAVPAITAHDETWATLLLAGFALVTGLLWACLIMLLARLRNARPRPARPMMARHTPVYAPVPATTPPARPAVARYAPVYAPVLATTAEMFGLTQWVTPLDVAGIILVCLAASAGWTARPTRR